MSEPPDEQIDNPHPPGHSTGPKSDDGKRVSSLNAVTHGCCSTRIILADEKLEHYEILSQGWHEDYDVATHTGRTLLDDVIDNHWLVLRAKRRYHEAEISLEHTRAVDWTDDQHKKIERFIRYRTTAERSFYRSLGVLEKVRKDRGREVNTRQRAKERADEIAAGQEEKLNKRLQQLAKQEQAQQEQAQKEQTQKEQELAQEKAPPVKPPASKKSKGNGNEEPWTRFEQWVEVRIRNGETETRYVPTNEEMQKEATAMTPHPDVVFRRITFLGGVPPEYDWVKPDDNLRQYGGAGIQRMTWDAWLACIAQEKDGHLRPAPFGKLRRWQKP